MLQALLLIGSSLLFVCMASLVACFAYHIVVRHRYRRHLRRHGRQSGSAADNVELTLIAPMSRSNRRLASLRRNGRGSDSIGASAPGDGDSTLDNGDSQLLGATVGGELPVRTLNLDPSLRPLECARTRVRLLRELGQGAFGRVYLASIAGLQVGSEEDALVAVKTLRADAADELVCDFEREASFVAQLEHANIIRLMGVCTGSEPLCLMYEYMNAGDLHDFLARSATSHFIARQRPLATSRHHHQSTSSDSEDSGRHPRITTEQQLSIGVQVARAMRYFANCNYVHRDLASRNCLVHIRTTSISGTVDGVSDMLIVKLADFGLARPVDQATLTYEGRELEAIPVRWLPFESSVFNIFSTASDVWSFGVLLWEVFSFAQLPYADLSHDEVLRHLGNGNHLSMPDNTPTEVYDVMVRCWHTVPEHRPTFDMLCSLLDDLYIKEQRGPRAGLS
jgi:receptor tyrosine kinase